jgi:hypothetical protein
MIDNKKVKVEEPIQKKSYEYSDLVKLGSRDIYNSCGKSN